MTIELVFKDEDGTIQPVYLGEENMNDSIAVQNDIIKGLDAILKMGGKELHEFLNNSRDEIETFYAIEDHIKRIKNMGE